MNQLTGKITKVFEPISGESKRNPGTKWMRQDYVMETNDLYPRTVAFNIFGEDRIRFANIREGETVTIDFEVNSREYEGRYYTDIQCRNVYRGDQRPAAPTPPAGSGGPTVSFGPAASPQQQVPQTPPNPNSTEDLPF